MTVSDLVEQPCNKSDKACYKSLTACSKLVDNLGQAVRMQLLLQTCYKMWDFYACSCLNLILELSSTNIVYCSKVDLDIRDIELQSKHTAQQKTIILRSSQYIFINLVFSWLCWCNICVTSCRLLLFEDSSLRPDLYHKSMRYKFVCPSLFIIFV
jgi:hypothetical protein